MNLKFPSHFGAILERESSDGQKRLSITGIDSAIGLASLLHDQTDYSWGQCPQVVVCSDDSEVDRVIEAFHFFQPKGRIHRLPTDD